MQNIYTFGARSWHFTWQKSSEYRKNTALLVFRLRWCHCQGILFMGIKENHVLTGAIGINTSLEISSQFIWLQITVCLRNTGFHLPKIWLFSLCSLIQCKWLKKLILHMFWKRMRILICIRNEYTAGALAEYAVQHKKKLKRAYIFVLEFFFERVLLVVLSRLLFDEAMMDWFFMIVICDQ